MQNRLKFLSLASLSLVYITMVLGVYQSSIHKSLSCSDWPLCPNGLLKPPEQRYVVEYFHRIFVVFTAGVIYATSIIAYVKVKAMRRLTLLPSIIVSIQIIIGALVVTERLDIMIVTAHLPIGVGLFGITLLVFLQYRKNYLTSMNKGTSGNLD
jgi:heme A synthase